MKVLIFGTEYDLKSSEDLVKIMDLTDDAKNRGASGDLSMIVYALLGEVSKGVK